jgi:hypothetical protein
MKASDTYWAVHAILIGSSAGFVSGQTKQWDHQCNKQNVKQESNCRGAQRVCAVVFLR